MGSLTVHEMTSRVEAGDSGALLDPAVFEQLVRVVVARVRKELAHDERVCSERRLSASAIPDESITRGGCR